MSCYHPAHAAEARFAACHPNSVLIVPLLSGIPLKGERYVKLCNGPEPCSGLCEMEGGLRRPQIESNAGGDFREALFQDIDDSSVVTLIFEAEDLKRAEAFFTSDDLREAMQNSGVVGKPDVYFLKG